MDFSTEIVARVRGGVLGNSIRNNNKYQGKAYHRPLSKSTLLTHRSDIRIS